VLLGKALRDSC